MGRLGLRLRLRWLALTLVLGIAGCATSPPAPDVSVVQERQGRFSVQSKQAMGQTEAVQGSFVWRRMVTGWQLDLNSPLGATLARLTVTDAGATLQQPDEPLRRARSAQTLLADVLGAAVPVDALEDWVDGRVQPNAPVTNIERDELGRIESFDQSGWRVRFTRYDVNGPGRIDVTGRQQGRDIDLRLVLEQSV